MNSRILATLGLDDELLARDLAEVARFPVQDEYSEYTFGTWRSSVLANGTGDHRDMRFRRHDGPLCPTALAERVPYLMRLVADSFRADALRWIRIFSVEDGLLISHRDFVEFERGFHRIHVPLATDRTCLHSEEHEVFHMRRGEVWYLDATTVHAACSLSSFRRVSLCLDFEPDVALDELVRGHARGPAPPPCRIERAPLGEPQRAAIRGLRGLCHAQNWRDLMRVLGKVHFYYQAGAGDCHDWLIEICQDDPHLLAQAQAFKRFCTERRGYAEKFDE